MRGNGSRPVSRRAVIAAGMATVLPARIGATVLEEAAQALPAMHPVGAIPLGRRRWLGGAFWGNRLHDWEADDGKLVCRPLREKRALSTAAILTLMLSADEGEAVLALPLSTWGRVSDDGFAGFLIGAGPELDYRGAALVQGGSGVGGGLLAVTNARGELAFREHLDEQNPFAFATLPSTASRSHDDGRLPADAQLMLRLIARGGRYELVLSLRNAEDGLLAERRMTAVAPALVLGGISIAAAQCSPTGGWQFKPPHAGGPLASILPERALGPIISCHYSLSRSVLKLSAQCMPLGPADATEAALEVRRGKGRWKRVATAPVGDGAAAQFRVTGWDATHTQSFRVSVSVRGQRYVREGVVAAEPHDRPLRIALFSCVTSSLRLLDGPPETRELPQARPTGRFDSNSIVFPHDPLVRSARAQEPDLLVFCGDQFYEQFPTRGLAEQADDGTVEELCLDGLYKWLLWCWAFRDLTAGRPTIVLMDDHDYFQPNYWGNGGRAAPERDHNRGGYTRPAAFVRMIERVETGHNPDPFDPDPVDQGISVYYGAFVYGGVSFAILEDRKFKTGILQGADMDVYEGQLLGLRQEAFLRRWKTMDPGLPKVVLTQTVWACPQTTPQGHPLIDFDSNGFPSYARQVAVSLVKDCGALILSGDQHMASLIRHGVRDFDDGPLQFTGPAGAAGWQRWFEPGALPNSRPNVANSGDFTDGFGNRMHVLAVAQPRITLAEYRRSIKGRSQRIMDRGLKREGFGMIIVDPAQGQVTMECWPWNSADQPQDGQYAGWPVIVPIKAL